MTPDVGIIVDSADQMRDLGASIGRHLRAGDVLLLHGDLGAGKTTLAQGIAAGLGIVEPIQSPTFTLVAERGEADGAPKLYHLDLYRLTDPDELESFGYESYLQPVDGVSVIEWPERAADWLPDRFLLVQISHLGGDRRRVIIRPQPDDAWPTLQQMKVPFSHAPE